jgi:hypothetical protein
MAWTKISEWCSARLVSGFCATIYYQTSKITKCSRISNEFPTIIRQFQLEHFNAVAPIWTEVAMVPEIDLELDSNEPNGYEGPLECILNPNYTCELPA